jgi:hypothetical protein
VQLITNAAGSRIVFDDIVRLFLDFAVIREIYDHRDDPPTRYDIWLAVYGCRLSLFNAVPVVILKHFYASKPSEFCFIEYSFSVISSARELHFRC